MLKKIMGVGTFAAILGIANALAAGQATTVHNEYAAPAESHAGYFLGANYATYVNNDYALMVGYVDSGFLSDLGFSYEYIKPNGTPRFNVYELRGDLGFRHLLEDQVYFTCGALAAYGYRDPSSTGVAPYAVGAFTGLDYQPLHNLLLSLKLSPFTYQRDNIKTHHANVFSDGSIGIGYMLN